MIFMNCNNIGIALIDPLKHTTKTNTSQSVGSITAPFGWELEIRCDNDPGYNYYKSLEIRMHWVYLPKLQ